MRATGERSSFVRPSAIVLREVFYAAQKVLRLFRDRTVLQFATVILALIPVGTHLEKNCHGDELSSPVNISYSDSPLLQLIQTGDPQFNRPPFLWQIFGNDECLVMTGGDGYLAVGANGGVGIGTAFPDRELHIVGSNNPEIRLEQNTESGYPAQTWGLEANDLNFMIHDVTVNTRPLKIETATPNNSLYVKANGSIGLGTNSPTAGLHMLKQAQGSTAEAMAKFAVSDDALGSLTISNHSASNNVFIPKIVGRSAGTNVAFMNEAVVGADSGTGPAITYNVVKGAGGSVSSRALVAYRNNNVAKVTIGSNGDVFATSFSPISSRKKKHDIADLESAKAAEAFRQLTPVEFVYNDDETGEKRIGFIAEDVPEIVANPDRQSVPIMDVVGLLTRVVKDQQQTIEQQKTQLDNHQQTITGQKQTLDSQQQAIARQQASYDEQQKTIAELMRRLSSLESEVKDR